MELAQKQCIPCRGGIPPLKGDALQALFDQLEKSWEMIDEHHLQKDYAFDSYREAVRFINLIADLAESEGHHPELLLSFRNVRVSIWTHKPDVQEFRRMMRRCPEIHSETLLGGDLR